MPNIFQIFDAGHGKSWLEAMFLLFYMRMAKMTEARQADIRLVWLLHL